jgi:stage V sporulation protein B
MSRGLGMVFRGLLARFLGDAGLGTYSVMANFYFSLVGPVQAAVSSASNRTIATMSGGRTPNTRQVVRQGLFLAWSGTAVAVAIVLLGALALPISALQLARAYMPWGFFGLAMACSATSAVLRGYFLAQQEARPVVLAQQIEEITHITVLYLFMAFVWTPSPRLQFFVIFGAMALGEAFSLISTVTFYRRQPIHTRGPHIPARNIRTELVKQGTPVVFNRLSGSVVRLVEASMLPGLLIRSGNDPHAAMAVFGQFTGMALPLLLFPTVVTGSLATAMVAAVARATTRGSIPRKEICQGLGVTALIGVLAALAFRNWGLSLCHMLYGSDSAGSMLRNMAWFAVPLYLDGVAASILRGLGRPQDAMLTDIMGGVTRLGMATCLGMLSAVFGPAQMTLAYMAGSAVSAFGNMVLIGRQFVKNR